MFFWEFSEANSFIKNYSTDKVAIVSIEVRSSSTGQKQGILKSVYQCFSSAMNLANNHSKVVLGESAMPHAPYTYASRNESDT